MAGYRSTVAMETQAVFATRNRHAMQMYEYSSKPTQQDDNTTAAVMMMSQFNVDAVEPLL